MTAIGLRGQELLRSDSSTIRFLVKPPPINEILKPPPVRQIDGFQRISLNSPFPATWSQFKSDFLALPLPEEFALIERFLKNMEMGNNYKHNCIWYDPEENIYMRPRLAGGGGLSTSVIQALYDQYSHEGKMRRKYDSIVRQDNFERQIYPKYNVELVKQITGFSTDSAAYAFMNFCDFKNDSLQQANNYDIYLMIQNCLTQFLLERP
jgi:hypothetical protein